MVDLIKNPLPYLTVLNWKEEFVEVEKQPTYYIQDNFLYITGGDGLGFVDYFGEYREGNPWIHPELEKWAQRNNGYWEWENPNCIIFLEN